MILIIIDCILFTLLASREICATEFILVTCLLSDFLLILRLPFMFTVYCLPDELSTLSLFNTRMLACAYHLASFYVLVKLFYDNPWTCMSKFWSLDAVDPSAEILYTMEAWWISSRLFSVAFSERLMRSPFVSS